MVKVKIESVAVENLSTDAIALFLFEDDKKENRYNKLDEKSGGIISSLIKKKKFSPKKLSIRSVDIQGKLKADTLILVGLGKKEEFSQEVLRKASAKAATAAKGAGAKSIGLTVEHLATKTEPVETLVQAASEGIILSQYSFKNYKKKKDDDDNGSKPDISDAIFAQKSDVSKAKSAAASAKSICEGVFLARDLQNHPGNVATPTYIANVAKKHCAKAGVKCKILGRKEIEKLKMGSFLSVARGSVEEPKFLVMEIKKGSAKEKPFVLVGKGLTFDTGGISIKPSAGMEDMKFDMSGGAAVIGTMYSAGLMKLKKNLVGLVPLSENMPGGKATKPGDIVTASDGQTIEVLNTDAEGRLILADALVYAKRYKPSKVIDLATLTGAMVVCLGHRATGILGTDDDLLKSIINAGERSGERCWQFPLWEEYEEDIKGKTADVKNIGAGRGAGSITAAAFLKQFVDYPWAHMDIAGTADNAKPTTPYNSPGGTGIGVRLLIDLLRSGK